MEVEPGRNGNKCDWGVHCTNFSNNKNIMPGVGKRHAHFGSIRSHVQRHLDHKDSAVLNSERLINSKYTMALLGVKSKRGFRQKRKKEGKKDRKRERETKKEVKE